MVRILPVLVIPLLLVPEFVRAADSGLQPSVMMGESIARSEGDLIGAGFGWIGLGTLALGTGVADLVLFAVLTQGRPVTISDLIMLPSSVLAGIGGIATIVLGVISFVQASRAGMAIRDPLSGMLEWEGRQDLPEGEEEVREDAPVRLSLAPILGPGSIGVGFALAFR